MSILVGIGGAGQHVAIAYLHLARLAGFTPVTIVVIDNDAASATTRHLQQISTRSALGSPVPCIPPYPTSVAEDTPAMIFQGERALLDLFIESNPSNPDRGNAQDILIKKGFFGCPQLSAIMAWAQFRNAARDEQNPIKRQILDPLRRSAVRRLGISGSIVGGCGSGALPQFVHAVQAFKTQAELADAGSIRMQAIANLLTFDLQGDVPRIERGKQGSTADRTVTVRVMRENYVSGLVYFKNVLAAACDRFVLIANPRGTDGRPNAGNRNQPVTPEYSHVLQAAIQHLYFNAPEGRLSVAPNERIRAFWSGAGYISPMVLPVPDHRFIRAAGDQMPFDNFTQPLDVSINGGTVNRLIPATSLYKWLWVARLQLELWERALESLHSFEARIRFVRDFRSDAQNRGVLKQKAGIRQSVELERADLMTSLDFMKDAFLNPGHQSVRNTVDSACQEVLTDANRGSWVTEHGRALAACLKDPEFHSDRFWRAWVPEEEGRWRATWDATSVGRLVWYRCRELAERYVTDVVGVERN